MTYFNARRWWHNVAVCGPSDMADASTKTHSLIGSLLFACLLLRLSKNKCQSTQKDLSTMLMPTKRFSWLLYAAVVSALLLLDSPSCQAFTTPVVRSRSNLAVSLSQTETDVGRLVIFATVSHLVIFPFALYVYL